MEAAEDKLTVLIRIPCKAYEDVVWAIESHEAGREIISMEGTLDGNMVRKQDLQQIISHPMALALCSHGLEKLRIGGDIMREAS